MPPTSDELSVGRSSGAGAGHGTEGLHQLAEGPPATSRLQVQTAEAIGQAGEMNEDVLNTVPTYTAEQVREAERPYLEAGVPLMMRAASALAAVIEGEIESWRLQHSNVSGPRILVLVGGGNNGGDALFAAAQLAQDGADVFALPLADRQHQEGAEAARFAGVRFVGPEDLATVLDPPPDFVIDGVLGTGTSSNPALRGAAREVIGRLITDLNRPPVRVIAVDIPSGLHPDTGQSDAVVLPADVTVTFGGVKQGLVAEGASALVGDLFLVEIGIGEQLAKEEPAHLIRGTLTSSPGRLGNERIVEVVLDQRS